MDDETSQKVFQNVMNLFIIPEIEKRKKEGKIDVGDTVQFVIHNEYIKEWAYSQDRVSGELVWIPVDRELKVKDKGLYEIVSMTDLLFVQGFVELWGKIILKPINPKLDTSESAKTATSL